MLDKSGSMMACRDATISGYNEFLGQQQREARAAARPTRLTLTLFDTEVDTRCNAYPIAEVRPLGPSSYVPDGMTALYDAVGQTIRKTEAYLASQLGRPRVLFMIQTDGAENSSKEWTRAAIFDLISRKRTLDGWAFLFLGADIDAFGVGTSMGISGQSTFAYQRQQTYDTYTSSSNSVSDYFAGRRSADNLAPDPLPFENSTSTGNVEKQS